MTSPAKVDLRPPSVESRADGSGAPERRPATILDDVDLAELLGCATGRSGHAASIDLGPVIPWIADPSGRLIHAGARGFELFGLDHDSAGHGWRQAIHPQDLGPFAQAWISCIETGEALDMEVRFRLADSSMRWMQVRAAPRRSANGEIESWYGTIEDVHERRSAIEALEAAEARYRYTIELCRLIPWSAGPDGQIQEVGQRWYEATGIGDELIGDYGLAAVHPGDAERTRLAWLTSVETGIPLDNEYRSRTSDGGYRWHRSRAAPLRDEQGGIVRWYGIIEDVHDRRMSEEDIRWRAAHDSLTGASNRTTFYAELERILDQSRVNGTAVGVILFDMDNFKWINDWLGHSAGDEILKHFSSLLRECSEPARFARLGGDEFAVLIPALDEESIGLEAERIFAHVQGSVQVGGTWVDLLSSAGLALFPMHGIEADELVRNADLALQNAKASGRKCLRLFEAGLRQERQRQGSMIRMAKAAVVEERIRPYYQPKVNFADGRVFGFEALLRWSHPTFGLQQPLAIEAAFHDRDVGWEISQRMLEKVTEDLRDWLDRDIGFGHVALNVAPSDLLRPDYPEILLEQLNACGLPTHVLRLEVTETVFLGRRAEGVAKSLHVLDEAGIRIALDDFGTGYASLAHLQRFPVKELKIDRSFVDSAMTLEQAPIACALIGLARSLKMTSVAEGVETVEQARLLKEAGCDAAQGFLFSPAMPAADVPELTSRDWPVDGIEP